MDANNQTYTHVAFGAAEQARSLVPPSDLVAANECLLDYFDHLESGIVVFTEIWKSKDAKTDISGFWVEWHEADTSMERAVGLVGEATE
jgi:hypothetical protein